MSKKNRLLIKEQVPDTQSTKEQDTSTLTEKEEKSQQSRGIIVRLLAYIFGARYLETSDTQKHIYYFIFLVILGILYITNGNIADKKIRDINKLNKELKELRSQYIITQSELMFLSKQSEVAKRVEPLGLKEPTQQPYLILHKDSTIQIY